MLIREQLPNFPELVNLSSVLRQVAHGTTNQDSISSKYYSYAEQEFAEELALDKIVSLLRQGNIRSTGRPSSEKKGTGKRWEGQQYKNHSKQRSYIEKEFWKCFVFQKHSGFRTARSENMEYADILLVLEECRDHLRDEVLAHAQDSKQEYRDSDYSTPYIDLMHQVIEEFDITAENQPIKETLVEWFLAQEIDGQSVSRATAEYLASFVRLPSSRTGGNRPWKIRAQQQPVD